MVKDIVVEKNGELCRTHNFPPFSDGEANRVWPCRKCYIL